MNRLALNIVLFLTLYLPVEDFLLKWVPVPYPVYLALRQIPDALVIVAAGIAVGARTFKTTRFRRIGRAADALLVLLVVSAFTSAVLQGGNLLTATLNLKALLRYVLVIYVLLNVEMGRREVRTFMRFVYVSLIGQFIVSAIQLVGPIEVDSIFLPRIEDTEVAGTTFQSTADDEAQRGYIFGTMTNTISYGGFLLVGLALHVTRYVRERPLLQYWGMALLMLFLAFMSGSRAVTIATVLLVGADHYFDGQFGRFVRKGLYAAPLLIPVLLLAGVDLTDNYFFEIFSGAYIDTAMEQRLGIVLLVLPFFLSALGPIDILFGLSADREILNQFLSDMLDVPKLLVEQVATIEDVYWISLLVYYGLIGFALFSGFVGSVVRQLGRLWRETTDALERRLVQTTLLLFVVAIPLNFLGQFFETRQFSFYLWAFVGVTLSYAAHRQERLQRAEAAAA